VLIRIDGAGASHGYSVGFALPATTAELAPRCSEVIGIDVDEAALAAAAVRLAGQGDVRLLRADVLDAELPESESAFDLVTAVASLHHLPLPPGLARLAELVRPRRGPLPGEHGG
jgi:ubiquinone/menaquinone biosynthesis C-methylase UbiE